VSDAANDSAVGGKSTAAAAAKVLTAATNPTASAAAAQASAPAPNPPVTPPRFAPFTATANLGSSASANPQGAAAPSFSGRTGSITPPAPPSGLAAKSSQPTTATLSSSAKRIGGADAKPDKKPQILDDQTLFEDVPQDLRDLAMIPMNCDDFDDQIRKEALILFKPIADWGCDQRFSTPGDILIYAMDSPSNPWDIADKKSGKRGFLSHKKLIIGPMVHEPLTAANSGLEFELDQEDEDENAPKSVDGKALLKEVGVKTGKLFTLFPQLQFRENVDFSNRASVDAWNHLVELLACRREISTHLSLLNYVPKELAEDSCVLSSKQLKILRRKFCTELTKSLIDYAILDEERFGAPGKCTPFGAILRCALDKNTLTIKKSCADYFWVAYVERHVKECLCAHLMRCITSCKSDMPLDTTGVAVLYPNIVGVSRWMTLFGADSLSQEDGIFLSLEAGSKNLNQFFDQLQIATQAAIKQIADEFIANKKSVQKSITATIKLLNGSDPDFSPICIHTAATYMKLHHDRLDEFKLSAQLTI
ncbi:MAG: hypothetical protein LBI39_04120, partial [Puniceicoccales bacterium]|jgi:hypothetical protein|nr:hypothetical protein [Puniceicoccales bacterium]